MKNLISGVVIAFGFLVASVATLQAAELVMIDARSCSYCAKFRRDVAPTYDGTALGQVAPLRRVSAQGSWPNDLAGVRRAPFAPVFILVENGREIGRFAGYTDAQAFFASLEPLIARL